MPAGLRRRSVPRRTRQRSFVVCVIEYASPFRCEVQRVAPDIERRCSDCRHGLRASEVRPGRERGRRCSAMSSSDLVAPLPKPTILLASAKWSSTQPPALAQAILAPSTTRSKLRHWAYPRSRCSSRASQYSTSPPNMHGLFEPAMQAGDQRLLHCSLHPCVTTTQPNPCRKQTNAANVSARRAPPATPSTPSRPRTHPPAHATRSPATANR